MAGVSYDKLIKIMLIGDSSVGKSCLMYRFVDDTFSASFISTVGIDFKVKTVKIGDMTIKVQVWDTAGQEQFHTITHSYYRGAMGIILVYDVTNKSSFQSVSQWLSSIEDNASENVCVSLVGNKLDLLDKRVISTDEGNEVAMKKSIPFFETSANTGENVEMTFLQMCETIINRKNFAESQNHVQLHDDGGANATKKTLSRCCSSS